MRLGIGTDVCMFLIKHVFVISDSYINQITNLLSCCETFFDLMRLEVGEEVCCFDAHVHFIRCV